MAIRQYRCIVRELNIRSQPRNGDQYKTGEALRRHEIITAEEERRVDQDGFTWVLHDRGWSAERSLDGKSVFLSDAILPRDRILGINIDPNNPRANPSPQRLTGVGWVRFVLHVDSRRETLEQAFAFYDPYIKGYAAAGTRILLILLQDMYVGNMPWVRGDWATYASGFAERAGLVARRYRGIVSAYQIWNENDIRDAPTSHYVAPSDYALLLNASVRAITQNDPGAMIISGGLASDISAAVQYMRDVRTALEGMLPIDGIGIHPYGHVPPDPDASPFEGWATGSLDNALHQFTDNFPGIPLWITEIGVARVDTKNQSYWPRIANYMEKTVAFVRGTDSYAVPTLIWFAWGDSMDQAGIVDEDQAPKGPIYKAFFQAVHTDYPSHIRPAMTPFDGKVAITHVSGEWAPEQSITRTVPDMAKRIKKALPNVGELILKGTQGTSWLPVQGGIPGVAGPGDLALWALEMGRYRIQLHAWHELVGSDFTSEINLIVQLSRTPGVASIVLDLNPQTLKVKTGTVIRNFMISLRRTLPAGYPLGVSFDGRPQQFAAVALPEWYPFITSWHPKIFHLDFGGAVQGPTPYLTALFSALRPYPKAILPMFQVVPPDQTRQAIRFATENHGTPGVAFWRLSTILATTSPETLAAIQGAYIPWLAGHVPAQILGTVIVRTTTPLNVRAVPATDAPVLLGELVY